MQIGRRGWGLGIFVLVSALYGVADAEDSVPKAAAEPETSLGMQHQVQLSPKQELAQADAFLARMSVGGATVRKSLEQARVQRDVVKTLCLNDKLNQIDVALRSAQDRRTALEQAVSRSDSDLADHEFTILQVVRQRVEQLSAEANQCIGEETGFIGESRVVTTIEPGMPSQDTTSYPESPAVVSLPPNCASCGAVP